MTGSLADSLFQTDGVTVVAPYDIQITTVQRAWEFYCNNGLHPVALYGFRATNYKQAKIPMYSGWQTTDPRLVDTRKIGGIGLRTGQGHVVVDCDSIEFNEALRHGLPDMVNTWQVQSGSGNDHYHYRLAPDVVAPRTIRMSGQFDFLSSGGQVVAPPTYYEGYSWQTVNRHADTMRILTQGEVNRIVSFLHDYKGISQRPVQLVTPPRRATAHQHDNNDLQPMQATAPPRDGTLRDLYDHNRTVGQCSRNKSLFTVAVEAYRQGYSRVAIERELLTYFVQDAPDRKHNRETDQQRIAEGRATIESAENYSPRSAPTFHNVPANHLREHFMQAGALVSLRVVEGLYKAGCTGGELLTVEDMTDQLKPYGIKKSTVRTAIKTTIDGVTVFELTQPNSMSWLTPIIDIDTAVIFDSGCYSRVDGFATDQKEALLVGGTHYVCRVSKSLTGIFTPKNTQGQYTAQRYRVPYLQGLMNEFDLDNKGSDILPDDCLQSSKKYRVAFLRAFLARCAGRWSKRYLAHLIGDTSKRQATLRRYLKKDIDCIMLQQVKKTPVNWFTVQGGALPEDPREFDRFGIWLQDNDGQRHSPCMKNAIRLLQAGQTVDLVQQLPTYHCLSDKQIPPHIWQAQPDYNGAKVIAPPEGLLFMPAPTTTKTTKATPYEIIKLQSSMKTVVKDMAQ